MNDELKAKLLGYLAKLETAAGHLETEIPETLEEYIRWTIVEGAVYTVISAIPLIVWLCFLPQFRRWSEWAKEKRDTGEQGFSYFLRYLTLAGALGGFVAGIAGFGTVAVKAYVAPRVVILEKLVSLTK